MEHVPHEPVDLMSDFEQWCRRVEITWLADNPRPPALAWHPRIWAEHVEQHTERWNAYITPLVEQYWQERGYCVIWPDNDSLPITLLHLESEVKNHSTFCLTSNRQAAKDFFNAQLGVPYRWKDERSASTKIADRLRQMEIELAEMRQHVAQFGVGVNSPYGEMYDAGGLILKASQRLRACSSGNPDNG